MPIFAVDTRDRVAQRVTDDYDSNDPRFVRVTADNARQAIDVAINGLAAAGEFRRAESLESGTRTPCLSSNT